jgi:meiotically up-regulated gene 157 (Mug157) protein
MIARRRWKNLQNRRAFIKDFSLALAGAPFVNGAIRTERPAKQERFISRRPPEAQRNFTSEAVEETIARVRQKIADPEIAWLFENCYPNTLDTTVRHSIINGQPDTFVITGDIEAMWLRDSSAQVWPYLPLAKQDRKLGQLLAGVIRRQTKCILLDPYANAFNFGATGSEFEKDLTEMKKELHERKYELDSLCYPIRLAYGYWKTTGDASIFDADWQAATKLILKTFREQQRFENRGPYRFRRLTMVAHDTAALDGYGNPTRPNGLIHSVFRPSDDACIYPLLIPSNFFAVRSLKQLTEIYSTQIRDSAMAGACAALAKEVEAALSKYAVAQHPRHGAIYAYEIDGFGNSLMMDDANVPSLLSLPYLDSVSIKDALYQATRRFVLSVDNPYFFRGAQAEGIGGPHVGLGMIWPMSIIMRALTSMDEGEIIFCLTMLKRTHAGTGLMHESFDKDAPHKFTRKWFAWANTLFGELIIRLSNERPQLLKRTF